ncbi:MAG: hypothetical protein GWO02_20120, partial [Gammaproteobacteria bacterium]|nr:hypothetical protein [Gammaproteobacteria bacterium]
TVRPAAVGEYGLDARTLGRIPSEAHQEDAVLADAHGLTVDPNDGARLRASDEERPLPGLTLELQSARVRADGE